jgi:hypothetical protein
MVDERKQGARRCATHAKMIDIAVFISVRYSFKSNIFRIILSYIKKVNNFSSRFCEDRHNLVSFSLIFDV